MAKATALKLAHDGISEFVKKIGGRLGEDVGELASAVVTYKARTLAETIRRAQEQVAAAGAEPHELPPRVLIPLLERASIEDDEEMRERWAALLAHAAVSDDPDDVPPIFAEILSQLTPAAATLLDVLGGTIPATGEVSSSWLGQPGGMTMSRLTSEFSRRLDKASPTYARLKEDETGTINVLIDMLVRQGLANRSTPLTQREEYGAAATAPRVLSASSPEHRMTSLGRQFLAACLPLTARPDPATTQRI